MIIDDDDDDTTRRKGRRIDRMPGLTRGKGGGKGEGPVYRRDEWNADLGADEDTYKDLHKDEPDARKGPGGRPGPPG